MIFVDQDLRISQSVEDPEMYLDLTDDVLKRIERSKTPELNKARSIIRNLRTRKLYKFVDEFLIPPDLEPYLNKVTFIQLRHL